MTTLIANRRRTAIAATLVFLASGLLAFYVFSPQPAEAFPRARLASFAWEPIGVTEDVIGVQAEGTLLAAAVTGEVEGGFVSDFLGIGIKGTAEGHLGAVGLEGELKAGYDREEKALTFKLKGGLAAVVGGTLGVEIQIKKPKWMDALW